VHEKRERERNNIRDDGKAFDEMLRHARSIQRWRSGIGKELLTLGPVDLRLRKAIMTGNRSGVGRGLRRLRGSTMPW